MEAAATPPPPPPAVALPPQHEQLEDDAEEANQPRRKRWQVPTEGVLVLPMTGASPANSVSSTPQWENQPQNMRPRRRRHSSLSEAPSSGVGQQRSRSSHEEE